MRMRSIQQIILIGVFFSSLSAQTNSSSITWVFNRVDSIGGYASAPLNQLPTITTTSQGNAAFFDGNNDGILLNCNPMGSAAQFTIEIIFRPDSLLDLSGDKSQPRVIHISDIANKNNRRVTMEARILPNQRWVLDTYIRSEVSNLTQIDSAQTHTCGEWHHAAIVYYNGIMKQYVDAIEQLSGLVTYVPIDSASGRISIGVRQDPRYWFKGSIRMIKVSRRALAPSEFTLSTTTGVKGRTENPRQMMLLQNYPNPFNPSTTINFQIPSKSHVSLKVYDVIGREVTTLLSEELLAGSHAIKWNAETFPSGVYFCRLQDDKFFDTNKLILLR